ncbi:type III-A CRISPR-associated RAMP protein Csm5 [Anaerobranca gottschalkii]|uniref:CRISPR system Cms protein Csm5 n=1 Tax=Anaerobranca gottschalkii DSM 13577 TaxID=1120990 RepID=A0A1I0A945_9FIRM|nr:type III-A CRISPR-associated RAMP protein Csm5 [Anaerobranca gottschalkii]SES90672.1 RAMP superfamily protein [Anaerobranca gottschalkii DSM 13577]
MKVNLETLTPVSIGSEQKASQFLDYIYDNNKVYYIDHDKLYDEIEKHPQGESLLEEYIKIIKEQSKRNSNSYNLTSFLISCKIDFKKAVLSAVETEGVINKQISLHIKTNNAPYIPGSTIKGAIRTAIIFNLFEEDDDTKLLYEYIFKNKDDDKKRGEKHYIGENYLYKGDRDILKHLQVSDSQLFTESDLVVTNLKRINIINNKGSSIPIVREVIKEGAKTILTIKTLGEDYHEDIKDFLFLKKGEEKGLLKLINEYTKVNISKEIRMLKKEKGEKALISFYENLIQSVEKLDNTQEAIMRIGWGKTYFDNTISNKLKEENIERIKNEIFSNSKSKTVFPTTRVYSDINKKIRPLGWVKITIDTN